MKQLLINFLRQNTQLILEWSGWTIAFLFVGTGLGVANHLTNQSNMVAYDNLAGLKLFQHADSLHQSHQTVRADIEQLRRDIVNLRQHMPKTADETKFLTQFSELAEKFNVTLHEYRPGNETEYPNCREKEIQVRCEGSYFGICRLLASLESIPRFAHVQSLMMSAPSQEDGNCSVDVRIQLIFDPNVPAVEGDPA
jgi:hypothetical protein